VLYTGDAAADHNITGVGFAPDFIWIKGRSYAYNHVLFDKIRGTGKYLQSNTTNEEATVGGYLDSFDSDGFDTGGGGGVNANGVTYVAWNWKAGTSASGATNGAGGSNKTYTASYNADAGFSIVNYVGNSAGGHTIPHHLGAIAEMVIAKNRDTAGDWRVYHHLLGQSVANDAHKWLVLNDTAAATDSYDSWWDVEPTSSVFSVGNGDSTNKDGDEHIAYCFRSIDGYSKVGSYTGNDNADGTFVYCGFKPAFVLIKNIATSGEGFVMMNNKSDPSNVVGTYLTAYGATVEQGTAGTTSSRSIDFVSNGFKIRGNSTEINDGVTHIFYAVAETPFKYSNAR